MFAVWLQGMNGGNDGDGVPNSTWLANTEEFIRTCQQEGIIPVLSTTPTVPNYSHVYMNEWVRSSGCRYIDLASSVEKEGTTTWKFYGETEAYLSSDLVHPTSYGAKAMCEQVLKDFPEISIGITTSGVSEAVDKIEQDMKDMEEMFLVNLPCSANTLRFEFSKMDYDPTVADVGSGGTWKKVSAKFHNVWDWTGSGTSFNEEFLGAFADSDNIVSVIAAGDTSAVTDTAYMFESCKSLARICLFDTSAVTIMDFMFDGCTSLTSIPLFNTSNVKDFNSTFSECTKVEGGSLALYQQASTQSNPPSRHLDTFKNCGKDTVTGAAELAQIPESWGGTLQEP